MSHMQVANQDYIVEHDPSDRGGRDPGQTTEVWANMSSIPVGLSASPAQVNTDSCKSLKLPEGDDDEEEEMVYERPGAKPSSMKT